jgi:hypothetical protein
VRRSENQYIFTLTQRTLRYRLHHCLVSCFTTPILHPADQLSSFVTVVSAEELTIQLQVRLW